ncbi:hypothetical protein CBL_04904 [Carabus blaptoides fortunei]
MKLTVHNYAAILGTQAISNIPTCIIYNTRYMSNSCINYVALDFLFDVRLSGWIS